MTYADNYNIRTTSVKFNDVGDALDGLITRNYAGLTTGTSTTYIATPTPAWDRRSCNFRRGASAKYPYNYGIYWLCI
jgi:hypothetical protein